MKLLAPSLCALFSVVARASLDGQGRQVPTTLLYNSDFTNGTYRIVNPGRYVLAENVVFNPNAHVGADPYDCFFPTDEQFGDAPNLYPKSEFTLGFFSAISIEASNVELDLNGNSIDQSVGHALMQRFFSVIELANSPFIVGQGPHAFTQNFVPATDVRIHNGRIGRSAHHGIHGNNNANVRIENVIFDGFEVAGVHLNGVHGLVIQNCEMRSRKDVPVLGTFSSARFLERYVDYLVQSNSRTTLAVLGAPLDALAIQDSLRQSINNVYHDVLATGTIDEVQHPQDYGLFNNPSGVPDGNSYCVATNKLGVMVHGFPLRPATEARPSRSINLHNVRCIDHVDHVVEAVALNQGGEVEDPVGSLIQLLNKDDSGRYMTIVAPGGDIDNAWYIGNVIANAQIFVGKAYLSGDFEAVHPVIDASNTGVTKELVSWVEAGNLGKLGHLATEGWLCNGDSMFHVQKGLVSFMISGTVGAQITDVHVIGAMNRGLDGSDVCGDYVFSHPRATLPYYNGAVARGFSFAGSEDITVLSSSVSNLTSLYGDAVAFDVHTDSQDVHLTHVRASNVLSSRKDATAVRFGPDSVANSALHYTAAGVRAPLGVENIVLDEGTGNQH